jgi:hypothetical protein
MKAQEPEETAQAHKNHVNEALTAQERASIELIKKSADEITLESDCQRERHKNKESSFAFNVLESVRNVVAISNSLFSLESVERVV